MSPEARAAVVQELRAMADAIRTTEVLFRRPDGSGVTFTDLLRERARKIESRAHNGAD